MMVGVAVVVWVVWVVWVTRVTGVAGLMRVAVVEVRVHSRLLVMLLVLVHLQLLGGGGMWVRMGVVGGRREGHGRIV